MKFKVFRASLFDSSKPCDEAVFDGSDWVIEFCSLEDLLGFINKYGDVIIYKNLEVYIYDYYVE